MKNKKLIFKLLSLVLAAAMLISCIPMTVSADTAKIRFGVISDIHYLAPSLRGGDSEEWLEFVKNKHKEYTLTDSLVDNALDGVLRNAVESGENYVLIPGDLTKDGELESHKQLVPMQPGDVPVTYADATALERDYGFTPTIGIREGLRAFAEWYRGGYYD